MNALQAFNLVSFMNSFWNLLVFAGVLDSISMYVLLNFYFPYSQLRLDDLSLFPLRQTFGLEVYRR